VLNRLDLVEKYAKDMGIDDWKMAALIILMRPIDVEYHPSRSDSFEQYH